MVNALTWRGNCLVLLDQTKLPQTIEYISCYDYRRVCEAIYKLEVRGAPAIGAAAAFGMVLGYKELLMYGLDCEAITKKMSQVKADLLATRPTAINLAWALEQMWTFIATITQQNYVEIIDELEQHALKIYNDDIANNRLIGKYGAALLQANSIILTHCNAGALATCGWGTALGVVRQAYQDGKIRRVYADESRPLLQGARLTAWELAEDKIPVTVITDNMAAWTMKTKHVDAVIVGADRIALNGDTANKIGTFGVALAAKYFKIPFYIAAPLSTFDFAMPDGTQIPIEERDGEEVRSYKGIYFTPREIPVFNPSFDVTPAELITGIITEYGVLKPPYGPTIAHLINKHRRNVHE